MLPLPHLFKATGFSYLFNGQFDKLCKNQSIFCVAQYLPILYNTSRAIKWFEPLRFGLGLFQLIPHYILAFQTCEAARHLNKRKRKWERSGRLRRQKKRKRFAALPDSLSIFFFVFFFFSIFCSAPLALNAWNRQNMGREEREGEGGTHIKGAKMLMAKLNSQMKTLLGLRF